MVAVLYPEFRRGSVAADPKAFVNAANYAAMRTLLGLGTADSPTFAGLTLDGDTTNPLQVTGYGAGGNASVSRGARGTKASPSALLVNDWLGGVGYRGYGATGFTAFSKAIFAVQAEENWTDSAQGTYFSWSTTAAGGTTRTEKMRLSSAGGLSLLVGALTLPTGSIGAPSINFGTANTGFYGSSNSFIFTRGGVNVLQYDSGGAFWLREDQSNIALGASADLRVYRPAAGVWQQRNGTTSQKHQIAKTYTSTTSHEMLEIDAATDVSNFDIAILSGSLGGSNRGFRIGSKYAGAATLTAWLGFNTSGNPFLHVVPTSDPVVAGAIWNDAGTLKLSAG